jgi:hypothetical protein
VAYAIDAGPLWVAQGLGVARLLVALAPVYVAGASVFDSETRKAVAMDDLPDATDLALHWVPGLCVWALTQALAIDFLGASMGALAGGLRHSLVAGADASRARLLSRELLRIAPTAASLIAAGILSALDLPAASYWVLVTGLGAAIATAACCGVVAARGGPTLLDAIAGTRAHRAAPVAQATTQPAR